MAKGKRPREKVRENTPLLFLLLVLFPLFGGYYNVSVLLAGVVTVLLLCWSSRQTGLLRLPVGPEAIALYGLCLGNLLAVPFAVSGGMAFTGFLRTLVWILFFLYAATYTREEREKILDAVACEGALLSGITIIAFFIDRADGLEDANGRIDGVFQYANTWALYLMAGLILLFLKDKKKRSLDWIGMLLLLAGIYLSGSRGVFLLLLGMALAYGGWYLVHKRRVVPLLLAGTSAAFLFGVSVILSGGMTLERLQAITLSSSSLNGRLLYALDGLRIIWRHPMGVGRGGYLYIQPLYQTGVYTLRYIHNEYLQAVLDGGLLAGLCTMLLPVFLLFRKGASMRERAVMFAITSHAVIDFDFQFSAVVFLLLLCGSGGRCKEVHCPRWISVFASGAAALTLSFFSAVYFFDFAGQPGIAYKMFPADLSLAESKLQSCASIAEAEPVADCILDVTDLSMVALDCKFAACVQRMDGPGMARAKYRYLRLSPYRGEVFEDFTQLLENLCVQASAEECALYRDLAGQALKLLEEVEQKTSPLAYRIADKPELAFVEAISARLRTIADIPK